ncbi:SIMPL domain-containing protein [Massilia endophytica]|uniref:SIMPL domain-containing protein n=1 Tax=Massilia endophytica TaxID=2899220 RepID=UPI001E2C5C8A|nr:SIMPL domain-containing protein [Massilia endophytica]UGQ46851.1 SIMPL domain-containing protein [Massilia endophytica]
MKKFALLLLLASLCGAANASPLPPYPFVSTAGRAQLWLRPDIGELQFDTGAQHSDGAAAAAALETVDKSVLALLAEQGIPEADIENYELSRKSVNLNRPAADGATTAWSLGRHFRIQVRDLAAWPQLLAALLALDHIDSISTSFDRTDAGEINRQLMKDAAAEARQNALQLAESFGRKLGPAMAIARGPLDKVSAPFVEKPGTSALPRPPRTPASSYAVPVSIPFLQSVTAVFKLQ